MSRIEDWVTATLDDRAAALARELGAEVDGVGDIRRVALSAGAQTREFGTVAQGARPRLRDAIAGLDLAAEISTALKEAIADDT
ncbi:hypothetical protein [Zavarzinia sp.]|uniref:hypothetical protein n=1 Tax=Zavarzinia sp. TaxID=2027920 RepID=UPI003BB59F3B